LDIQNALAAATITGRGYFDPGVERAFTRAEVLAERLNATEERFWALLGLHTYQYVVGNYPKTLELSERLVSLAESAGSPNLRAIAWLSFAIYHIWQCDFRTALAELERAHEIAPPDDDSYRNRMGSDLRVTTLAFGTVVRWHLGLLDQARRHGARAIALAREIGHPFTLALARLFGGAGLAHYLRDAETALAQGQELYDDAVELGFHVWSLQAAFLIAWARVQSDQDLTGRDGPSIGDFETAQRTIQQSAGGAMPYFFAIHAEILAGQGRLDQALRALEEGLAICDERGIRPWTEEIYRLRGELLMGHGGADPAELENLFHTALARARENHSKVLELRAALSLGRLWCGQGRVEEARDLVAGVYGGFSEGFDTFDLREAAEFLSSLPAAAAPAEATD
jgi:adenylate cyclase